MNIIIIVLFVFLFILVLSSSLTLFAFKIESTKILTIIKYVLPSTFLIILFLLNYVSTSNGDAYTYIMLSFIFLITAKNVYSDYMTIMRNSLHKESLHICISNLMTIVIIFAIIYSSIEMYIPNSFSNISTNDPFAMSIDFIYFSITTFATVGFGDITPQTTLARAVVTLEIIVAFAMLVLAVNFFVRKKDNKKEEEKDEKKLC